MLANGYKWAKYMHSDKPSDVTFSIVMLDPAARAQISTFNPYGFPLLLYMIILYAIFSLIRCISLRMLLFLLFQCLVGVIKRGRSETVTKIVYDVYSAKVELNCI